jgi:hypothetical protein
VRGVGEVEFLRGRHDRHAAGYLNGELTVVHLGHLPLPARAAALDAAAGKP